MTRKSKARYGLKRTYRINPTVKALRAALMAGVLVASVAPAVSVAAPFRHVVIEDIAPVDDAFVYNEDDLAALAENIAAGIVAFSDFGDAGVVNHGDISAVADASLGLNGNNAIAAGIYAYAKYEAAIVNDGDISAIAIAQANGSAQAYGLWAFGGESAVIENAGNIEVYAASEYGNATAVGIYASSNGDTVVDNLGDITVSASVSGIANVNTSTDTTANAYGIQALSEDFVSVNNSGNITLSASND